MKCVKLFCIVILLVISLITSRKVKTTTSNNKLKTTKKNKIDDSFNVFIRFDGEDSGNTEYTGKCTKDDVTKPEGNPLGLLIRELPALSGTMATALFKSGSNYYLPYRSITSNWSATQTGLTSRDFIQTTVTVGGKGHSFKLKVPYNTFSRNPVTYDELVTISNTLNTYRSTLKTKLTGLKDTLNKCAGDYSTNMDSVDKANGGISSLKAQVTALQAEYDALKTTNTNLAASQATQENAQSTSLANLGNYRASLKTNTDEQVNISNEIEAIKKNIVDLQAQISSGAVNKDGFTAKATTNKTNYTTAAGTLGGKVPELNGPSELTNALNSFNGLKPDDVKAALNKIIS